MIAPFPLEPLALLFAFYTYTTHRDFDLAAATMSRHRLFQNYDYANDMDEFDGANYEDDGEEAMDPEDEARLREATRETTSRLGDKANSLTVKQIQESVWHYYFDVDQAVDYLSKLVDKQKAAPKPAKMASPKLKPKPDQDGKLVSVSLFISSCIVSLLCVSCLALVRDRIKGHASALSPARGAHQHGR